MSTKKKHPDLAERFSDTLNSLFVEFPQYFLPGQALAVAYSGGLDSSVLLMLAATYCKKHQIPLHAFHVHHGLSVNADSWLFHCQSFCHELNIDFSFEKITLSEFSKDGIEASARKARYKAIGDFCRTKNISVVLTGHHLDDQAETLLLQMLRGAGPTGLSGMDKFNFSAELLGNASLILARPLLEENRPVLDEFAAQQKISFIQDESNHNIRFIRNALRHQVMPLLEDIAPGFATRFARVANHMQSAAHLIEVLAAQDLNLCRFEDGLRVSMLQKLEADRVDNVLRLWLRQQHLRMPSLSRLREIVRQLFEAKPDAKVTIFHETIAIHRYQDGLYASDRSGETNTENRIVHFRWQGEASRHFPDFRGTLYFHRQEDGLNPEWLAKQDLTLHLRRGGERLKLAANRPTRSMKSHYQALNIPFWMRQQLPFVSIDDDVLFAAGVGMNAKFCNQMTNAITFLWVDD